MSFNKTKITKKRTMKKYLFKKQLLSLAAFCGIVLAFASCANEEVAQNTTGAESDNDKNLTAFVAGDEATTRTSLDYNSGNFYWEAGDYIYVKDDNGVLQKRSNAPTSKVASFKYMVPGKFTASSSYKVYYLGKNSYGTSVSISPIQVQSAPDNTVHFGVDGDYGTATATKVSGKQQFEFALEHQPAYLVFQPYINNTNLRDCYLVRIEVTSDNDIAEIYTVNQTTGNLEAVAGTGDKQIILTTKDLTSGSSYSNGFPLTNSSASVTTNGAYMVIKPGTHTLKVRYWLRDVVSVVEGAFTKTYPSTTYASNTYYDMKVSFNLEDYDGTKYYMWDAKQNYWAGHEWNSTDPWQPKVNWGENSNYPQSNSDASRWYNEGGGSGRFDATESCANLPNVNEMTWYAVKGDPRWDGDKLWTTMGHLYKGGMWFKKKANIEGYNANTAVDGTDWRTSGPGNRLSVSTIPPSAADADKYFFLPAFGRYLEGQLLGIGYSGFYMSSSADPASSTDAFGLNFSKDYVIVGYGVRQYGFRADALQ